MVGNAHGAPHGLRLQRRSLEVNFGAVPRVPLPFTCTMLSSAAKDDVEQSQPRRMAAAAADSPMVGGKDGKSDFVLPIGLPDAETEG
eukprot:Skav213614  [mRNA]  locus=scaffold2986:173906:174745:+ [translate_table: standard]